MSRITWNSSFASRPIRLSLTLIVLTLTGLAQAQPEGAQAPERASAQQPAEPFPGTINGTVIDSTGAVIAGARVTLNLENQSQLQETRTGEAGGFSFSNVVPGSFEIRVAAGSFAEQTFSGTLNSGETFTAPPITLTPASISTEIQVRPQSVIAEQQIKEQEKQRVFGVVPNFYVTYAANAVPLGPKQKFELAWKASIDPVTFGLAAVGAGVQQAQNTFGEYGQGAEGYAKRFGANYADETISTFMGSAVFATLFKQDPRYFYKGTGSTRSRILYALANSVICKGDNQRWQPCYSAILGGLAAAGISNLYYPPKDRGAALTFENVAIGTGTTAALNLLQEFVVRKLTPHASK